jgi:hypothetical protein
MMRAAFSTLAFLALLAVTPAHAQRAGCERYTDAHAYNRCLAAAGPASRAASGSGVSAAPRSRAQAQRSAPRRSARAPATARSGATVQRLPNGRLRLTIPTRRR